MIVQMRSAYIVSTDTEAYLDELQYLLVPDYLKANGILSVTILRREFVAYTEVVIVFFWQSEEPLGEFMQRLDAGEALPKTALAKEPATYRLVSTSSQDGPD